MAAKRQEIAKRLHGDVTKAADREIRPGMSNWHQAVGVMVHRAAGSLAEHRHLPPSDLAGVVTDWVNANAKDTKVFGNLAKARAQITGCACLYLSRYAPGLEAEYLGTEIEYHLNGDHGRVDLAWSVPGLGIVIDEIKTQSWTNLAVDDRMLEQVERYRRFGVAEWGDHFAGVRFLPLRFPSEMRFLGSAGAVESLTTSIAASVRRAA